MFRSPVREPYFLADKMAPLVTVMFGGFFGYLLSRLRSPLMRRMFFLNPITQIFAISGKEIGIIQKETDNGWVRAGSVSVSSLSAVMITHFTPLIGMGLCTMILF